MTKVEEKIEQVLKLYAKAYYERGCEDMSKGFPYKGVNDLDIKLRNKLQSLIEEVRKEGARKFVDSIREEDSALGAELDDYLTGFNLLPPKND